MSTKFWKNISPPSPVLKIKPYRIATLLGSFFDHEDGNDMFLQNVG
jgi:hypothetical protein